MQPRNVKRLKRKSLKKSRIKRKRLTVRKMMIRMIKRSHQRMSSRQHLVLFGTSLTALNCKSTGFMSDLKMTISITIDLLAVVS